VVSGDEDCADVGASVGKTGVPLTSFV